MLKTAGKRIISWVLAVAMVFAMVGVVPVQVLGDAVDDGEALYPVELDAPFGLSVDADGVLTWYEVENAVGYDVYVDWVAFNEGYGGYIASDVDVVSVDVPRMK